MRKHILIVSQYFYPEQFRINDIALELLKQGHKVTVLTGIPNYPKGKFYPGYNWCKKRKEQWNGVDIIRIPLFARGKSKIGLCFNYVSFVFSGFFWKLFTKIKADVVFTFEVSPMTQALIGVWYAKKRKIPHYIYVQDLWPENLEIAAGIRAKWILKSVGKMTDYIYKHSRYIFATSQSFVQRIQQRNVANAEKTVYLPQYAEDFYIPIEKHSNLIAKDGRFNITFTGNIGRAQGLDILLATAELLQKEGDQVRFNLVGDGSQKAFLQQEAEKRNLNDYFCFIPSQPAESIPEVLSANDAALISFVDSELYAMTIPAKLQSYMACGMPILAIAKGETKRIIEEAECGVCCAIASANMVRECIRILMESDRNLLANNARKYYLQHFRKEEIIEKLSGYLQKE